MVVKERVGSGRGETEIVTVVGEGVSQGVGVEAGIARNMMVGTTERDMLGVVQVLEGMEMELRMVSQRRKRRRKKRRKGRMTALTTQIQRLQKQTSYEHHWA